MSHTFKLAIAGIPPKYYPRSFSDFYVNLTLIMESRIKTTARTIVKRNSVLSMPLLDLNADSPDPPNIPPRPPPRT
jgi:hypothetical protein